MEVVIQSKLEVGDLVTAAFSGRVGTVTAIAPVNLPSYNDRWGRTDAWHFEYRVQWDDAPKGWHEVRYLADLLPLEGGLE